MGFGSSKSSRIHDDTESATAARNISRKLRNIASVGSTVSSSSTRMEKSTVFPEDYKRGTRKIFDPRGKFLRVWNKIFLVACIVSLFVDPLFFYLQLVWKDQCINIGVPLEVILTIVRSISDLFYMIQIFVRFRTAYVAPSSRVFGRGELVIDSSKIATRYLRTWFFFDLMAALPLPQALIWFIIPNLNGSTITNTKNVLRFIIICQYIPRLLLIYPLSAQITKAHGLVTETAWVGAAYNLTLYMLASHVLGACWYLLALERKEACWRSVCNHDSSCNYSFFDCNSIGHSNRAAWFQSSNISSICNAHNNLYAFGIYADALSEDVTNNTFAHKYFYCLWWGLKNLSSLGQNLSTTSFVGEILFAIIIAILGLVLFALLIGNMQRYLQSTTLRLEEWRVRRTDTEQWMHHRQLPAELREAVRRYDQYKWAATRGVDEETLMNGLPLDLRREIKRHLCLDLVRRVPLFEQMDERTLDAVCERLKPALCTERTVLVREGDPVNEMLFIIRGHLDSFTTNGGRTGFFNSSRIGPGEFCGEELLTWALEPRPGVIFPSSTRTVKAISEVEAFALRADDLIFVSSQFRMLHSKKIRHKLRFYSHQWRTWAASFIQIAWRRHRMRKEVADLQAREATWSWSSSSDLSSEVAYKKSGSLSGIIVAVNSLRKPHEDDFLVDED